MKKLAFIFLLMAGTVPDLSAQLADGPYYYQQLTASTAEGIFDSPRPGKAKVNFHFFNAFNKGKITLELTSIKQMNHLPNLDSLVAIAKAVIAPLADSLKQDGVARRVDVNLQSNFPQVRINTNNNRPPTFVLKDGEMNILKTENDTLRIKLSLLNDRKIHWKINGSDTVHEEKAPAFIAIIMNNFEDLTNLPPNVMQNALALLRQDITPQYVTQAPALATYSAYYNLSMSKRFSPGKTKWIRYGRYRSELVPNIYGSFQYVRGSFAPATAAGLRYSIPRSPVKTTRFYLMLENYFFFSRDAQNKLVTDVNGFVTFRYIEDDENERKSGGFEFISNVSLGYLARRRGEWFEKNTFKFALPGVRSGWLQVEPEFYFNNFVKNFSPTLKLTLHYE